MIEWMKALQIQMSMVGIINVIEIVIFNANYELKILKEEACRILSRELVDLDLI